MNFGAINKDGGEPRLNVAITRARMRLQVFSSHGCVAPTFSPRPRTRVMPCRNNCEVLGNSGALCLKNQRPTFH